MRTWAVARDQGIAFEPDQQPLGRHHHGAIGGRQYLRNPPMEHHRPDAGRAGFPSAPDDRAAALPGTFGIQWVPRACFDS